MHLESEQEDVFQIAEDRLRQAIFDDFPSRIALVSSFGSEAVVLLHLVARLKPDLPVLFLNTGRLFSETLKYRDILIDALGLANVQSIDPDPAELANAGDAGNLWFRDPDACCHVRKVLPLQRALASYDAWINGRKRFQSAGRGSIPLIETDAGKVKYTPLADWTAADLKRYSEQHQLPPHPLVAGGYTSIGCAPCTSPPQDGGDVRSGRWAGRAKTECGIHLSRPISTITTPL